MTTLAIRTARSNGRPRSKSLGENQRQRTVAGRRGCLAGYREELLASGIDYDPALVYQGDWQVQSGYRLAQQLLALPERPTAVFAANDLMALGVLYAAQEVGLDVPNNLALVGYDDRDFTGFMRPALTTIQMPCEKLGQVAADSLLRLIKGEAELIQPTLVQGELVVRQSCGMVKGEWVFEPEKASLTRVVGWGKISDLEATL